MQPEYIRLYLPSGKLGCSPHRWSFRRRQSHWPAVSSGVQPGRADAKDSGADRWCFEIRNTD